MRFLLAIPLNFIRLVIQSIALATSQIWANKVRSVLTTLGIIIGVASVTAVIAALTGLKTTIMSDLETFGTNKIFIGPRWPDKGPSKNASWRIIRFKPEQFEGLLQHCPSVQEFTRISGFNDSVRHGERSIENARITGVDTGWIKIESRGLLEGRPFSLVDETQGRRVCLVDPLLRDKLHMDKDCVGEFITIGNNTFRVIGVIEERPSMAFGGGRGENFEVFIPFTTHYRMDQPWFHVMAASKSPPLSDEAQLCDPLCEVRRQRGRRSALRQFVDLQALPAHRCEADEFRFRWNTDSRFDDVRPSGRFPWDFVLAGFRRSRRAAPVPRAGENGCGREPVAVFEPLEILLSRGCVAVVLRCGTRTRYVTVKQSDDGDPGRSTRKVGGEVRGLAVCGMARTDDDADGLTGPVRDRDGFGVSVADDSNALAALPPGGVQTQVRPTGVAARRGHGCPKPL